MTKHRIRHHHSWLDICYRTTDAAGIVAGLWLVLGHLRIEKDAQHVIAAGAAVIVYTLVAEITGAYRNWRGASAERECSCALLTWAVTLPALLTIGRLSGFGSDFSGTLMIGWFATAAVLVALSRLLIRWAQRLLRAHGCNIRGFAVVGVNELGFQLARNIDRSADMGLKLIGFYDDRTDNRVPEVPADIGLQVGTIGELVALARSGRVNMIYITFPMRAETRIRGVLQQLSDTTASVYLVPDFFVYELLHVRWTSIGGVPAVSVFEHPFYGVDGIVKRVVDVVLATAALVVLAIPMLVIAGLIKLSSPGPVFFRQRRYGLDGREIKVWKFRSMTVCEDGPNVLQAHKNDARVTPLGAILRKTSVDELPQLFNVLQGNMSLVGPRPHASAHNEAYRRRIRGYMLRHKVKPGITGLAQVSGWRGETDTLDKMEGRIACDHRYIGQWSLWLDLKILFRTIFVVLSRQDAY